LRQGVSNADWLSDEVRLWFLSEDGLHWPGRDPAARTPVLNFSEQPRAGMPDKGLGIAGIGFQHLKAAVAGYVGDLEQVRTALDGARDEAGAKAVAGKSRGLEAELAGAGLDDCGDVAGTEPRSGDALIAPVEHTPEDGAFSDAGGLEPGLEGYDRAGNLAPRDGDLAALAFLVGFGASDRN
jgi:hypothetical protein